MVIPALNRTRGLFLRREALLVLLSYGIMKLVEVEGIAPTRSILQGLAVAMTVTPKSGTPAGSPTRISRIRSAALL